MGTICSEPDTQARNQEALPKKVLRSETEIEEDRLFKIPEQAVFFNSKQEVLDFINVNSEFVDNFNRIECFGNSYDESSCSYVAELIAEKSSPGLHYADFSNMFVTRQKTLPPSLKILIDSVTSKPIQ